MLKNAHGDVTMLLDAAGVQVARYVYDAFGNHLQDTGTAENAGYRYDSETGLYYLNSRYYDPTTARFIQEDTYRGNPGDPISLHLYTYCNNNPIIYVDPLGFAPSAATQAYNKKAEELRRQKEAAERAGKAREIAERQRRLEQERERAKNAMAAKKALEAAARAAAAALAKLSQNPKPMYGPTKPVYGPTKPATVYGPTKPASTPTKPRLCRQ